MTRIPGNEWVENPNRGFTTYVVSEAGLIYKPVFTYHQTVGMQLSKSYVAGHRVPPHNWINPYTKTKWQTQELNLAGKALYQPQYSDHWVNRHFYNIQCEIVGVPEVNVATYTEDQLKWIAEEDTVPKVRWLRENGMDLDLNQVHQVTNSSGSASEYWPGRCSEHEMAVFNGITHHIKWPGNDHWDCSVERLDRIAHYAKLVLGGSPPGVVEKVAVYAGIREDVIVVGGDGNVYLKTYYTGNGQNPPNPRWEPAGSDWAYIGAPPGGATKVAANWDGEWFSVYAISKDNTQVYQKRNHPAHGWVEWASLGGNAVELATTVQFKLL